MRIDLDIIVDILDQLGDRRDRAVHLELDFEDHRVAWRQLATCNNGGLPAIQFGQRSDCRWSLRDGRSLHVHWFDGYARFHIDQVDPRRSAVGHLLTDTWGPRGAALGLLALPLGPAGALAVAVAGAAGATALQTRSHEVWVVESFDRSNGWWEATRAA